MKKHLLALAALATVSGAAFAQSATVYGILDTSIVVNNNASTTTQRKTSMESGVWLPSLFGITGSEDLGGGMKASFKLEANLNTDTGVAGKDIAGGPSDGGLFDRQAWVGLSGGFGELRLGKQIDALFLQSFLNNVRLSHSNSAAVIGGLSAGATWNGTVFSPNTVTYTTPAFNGFKLTAQHQLGEEAGDTKKGAATAGLVNFDGVANLSLSAGIKTKKAASGKTDSEQTLVGAVYKLGALQLNAQFNEYKFKAGADTAANAGDKLTLNEFGVGYSVTPALVAAINYVDYNWKDTTGVKYTSEISSVSLKYSLSKRTSLWTMASTAGKLKNTTSAAAGLPATPAYLNGQGNGLQSVTGYSVGVTHSF